MTPRMDRAKSHVVAALVAGGLAAAGLAGTSIDASAEVARSAYRNGNFTFSTATTLVPLNNNSKTKLGFRFRDIPEGWRIITYSAECAVAGTENSWVDIDILVDGNVIPPTDGSSDAFCSGNATPGFDGWATQSITVAVQPGQGNHRIQIRARLNGGATGGWFGDTSLVIYD